MQCNELAPSVPYSFEAQTSQNVEKSRNVHWLPKTHGLSAQSSTVAETSHTAPDDSCTGASMVELVTRYWPQ